MELKNVILKNEEGIGWLIVNRPEQLNALNADTLRDITDGMRDLSTRSSVRVIILTGAGDKAFIAGADIKAMADMTAAQADEFVHLGHTCMDTIQNTPQPVIGMVNGYALGGGMEVALACDFLVASNNVRLGLPEVTLGLFPGFGGTQRLLRLVGRSRTMELISTGRQLNADEALAWGIVNRVVDSNELKNVVLEIATKISANSPVAIRTAKKVILAGCEKGLSDGLAAERDAFPQCFETGDCKEGLNAFLERRKPAFVGK